MHRTADRDPFPCCSGKRDCEVDRHQFVYLTKHAGSQWCSGKHVCQRANPGDLGGNVRAAVAPDLSYRQALANFGLPTLKERREGLARDFFIKLVRNLIINCANSSHTRELSSMAFEQLSRTKTQSTIQPELRRPLFPMGLLTGYKPPSLVIWSPHAVEPFKHPCNYLTINYLNY